MQQLSSSLHALLYFFLCFQLRVGLLEKPSDGELILIV